MNGPESAAYLILSRHGKLPILPHFEVTTKEEISKYYGVTISGLESALCEHKITRAGSPENVKTHKIPEETREAGYDNISFTSYGCYYGLAHFNGPAGFGVMDVKNYKSNYYSPRAALAAAVALLGKRIKKGLAVQEVVADILSSGFYKVESVQYKQQVVVGEVSEKPINQDSEDKESVITNVQALGNGSSVVIALTPEMLNQIVRASVSAAVDVVINKFSAIDVPANI